MVHNKRMTTRKIVVPADRSIYDLQNTNLPHWYVGLSYGKGRVHYKAIPNDRNDKELHESTVVDIFAKMYSSQRWDTENIGYKIIGRDGDGKQRHDYTIKLDYDNSTQAIEITTLGDGIDSHLAHTLRDTASKLAGSYPGEYFIFLPRFTRPKELTKLFIEAQTHDAIDAPDHEDNDALYELIESLKTANEPYIRRNKSGIQQIHTSGDRAQTLREALQSVINDKESKDYSPFKQEDMILVIDDKSLYHSREYIDQTMTLMNHYFMGSRFREIFIVSRKNNPSRKKNAYQEAMFTPVKASWHPAVFSNIVYVTNRLNKGDTLPLNW